MIKVWLFLFFLFSLPLGNWAQAQSRGQGGEGQSSYVGQTQKRRSQERFNIIDWLTEQKKIRAEQDAKYRGGSGSGGSYRFGPYPDFVIHYRTDTSSILRDDVKIGMDKRSTARFQFFLDDLISSWSQRRGLSIDVGFEVYGSKTTDFTRDEAALPVYHDFIESGAALLIRPFGRSTQDTGLWVKGGYVDIEEMGLWDNGQTPLNVFANYWGAEAKLYLMPFLGVRAEYQSSVEADAGPLSGKWRFNRTIYAAFLEIYFLAIEAHSFTTEFVFTPTTTQIPSREVATGTGFSATLFF